MSVFSFNFNSKRPMDRTVDKENHFKSFNTFSSKPKSSVGQNQTIFGIDRTPTQTQTQTQRSVFSNKSNEMPKSPISFGLMTEKSKSIDCLTIDSTVKQISDDSNAIRRRVAEELEKIETHKALTEMQINRKTEEIKHLKSIIEDLENKLVSVNRENSELRVNVSVGASERQEITTKMDNTRDMFVKLKDFVQTIENRIEGMDSIKEGLDFVNEDRTQKLNQLTQRFSKLDLKHQTIVSDLKTDITKKNSEFDALKHEFNKINLEFEVFRNESNKNEHNFVEELNGVKQEKDSMESTLNQMNLKIRELTEKLIEFEERHESDLKSIEQKEEELERLKQLFETQIKELKDKIESHVQKETDLSKVIEELKIDIEVKEKQINDFKLDIESKDKSISDLEKEIEIKVKEIVDILAEKTDLIRINEELNSKVSSIENERQVFESSVFTEKESLLTDFDKTIKGLESEVESLREEKNQLIKAKEENVILLDQLESKLNQSVIEKETIEEELKIEIKSLKDEFERKMTEFKAKIDEMDNKIKSLNDMNQQKDKTISEVLSEKEVLKLEKEDLKEKLEKEERSLSNQISNMSTILESCKSDYNKRIDDKEDRIKEYKRENERMRQSVDHLTKKCERLESEKQSTNRKLQELTLSAMRSSGHSPNRVLTPKFMSPIESTRLSTNRTSSPFIRPLDLSPEVSIIKSSEEDIPLSAKEELRESFKTKSVEKLAPLSGHSQSVPKAKSESKPMATKRMDRKQINIKLNDSNSSESLYELIDQKLKKTKKVIRKQTDSSRHRINSPVKVDMKSVKDISEDTEDYDFEKPLKEAKEPLKKKLKSNPAILKTYGKKEIRPQNVLKGRPTPTKNSGDLSWLDF